jgi:fumarylacetoacetate (FAA) hydrolase family protein
MDLVLDPQACLPADHRDAALVGRVWRPELDGPSVVALRHGRAIDVTAAAATMTDLINHDDPVALARETDGEDLGAVEAIVANAAWDRRDPARPWLIAPNDLQAIKAAGVTFVESMLERVIEEQAEGDAGQADSIRATINTEIGSDLSAVVPGSPEAARLKQALIDRGLWSQYLEVGIGPDAEVFTKAPPMSAVGLGAEVGLHPRSDWNNPEPEVVLVLDARGRIAGATLGNDVNLRDFEGRSALLLGRAKDNNGSCAIGPLIRLIDDTYTLDAVRGAELTMKVEGDDGFVLDGTSSMSKISRDIEDLAGQTLSPVHQYPDGAVLFTGTMFSPIKDRAAPGAGFTHKLGDIVTISSPRLGALINRVNRSDKIPPWTFGSAALMANLAKRGLL